MDRNVMLQKLSASQECDVLIIGGGATGLGIALDSAARGNKTILVEKSDFAKATSSRSTKLIHGGVRYLEQGNISLVMEALHERWHMLRNAPSCTSLVQFVLPVYNLWSRIYYYTGLKLYEWLSGWYRIGRTRWMDKQEVLAQIPDLEADYLLGGVLYHDGQFNDSLLCIRLAQAAAERGAVVINYMECTDLIKSGDKVTGIKAVDLCQNKEYDIHARCIINATGVFGDEIMTKENPGHLDIMSPSIGVHVVVNKDERFKDYGLLVPKTTDGRVLFAMPWMGKLVIGTTDSPSKNHTQEPKAPEEDVWFILKNINRYLSRKLQPSDIQSVFAGIRPLVKGGKQDKTSSLSRSHTIIQGPGGIWTITGGKWTTYRKMAEDLLNRASVLSGLSMKPCSTKNISLERYYPLVEASEYPEIHEKIHPSFDYRYLDVYNAVMYEMAQCPEDVLARRTRILFLDAKAAQEAAPGVTRFMQKLLHKDENWAADQIQRFNTLASQYIFHPSTQ